MKVLIVDDHDVVREGLKAALSRSGCEVVAEARGVKEAMAFIAHAHPDAVLVDLNLPDGNGLEIITWARSISKRIILIVVTMSDEDELLVAAMRAGAQGFIRKSAPISEILTALEMGEKSPTLFAAAGLERALRRRSDLHGLTARELEVLHHLGTGATNAQIAQKLYLSEATIKSHLASTYRKLGVTNRTAAIAQAREDGLLK